MTQKGTLLADDNNSTQITPEQRPNTSEHLYSDTTNTTMEISDKSAEKSFEIKCHSNLINLRCLPQSEPEQNSNTMITFKTKCYPNGLVNNCTSRINLKKNNMKSITGFDMTCKTKTADALGCTGSIGLGKVKPGIKSGTPKKSTLQTTCRWEMEQNMRGITCSTQSSNLDISSGQIAPFVADCQGDILGRSGTSCVLRRNAQAFASIRPTWFKLNCKGTTNDRPEMSCNGGIVLEETDHNTGNTSDTIFTPTSALFSANKYDPVAEGVFNSLITYDTVQPTFEPKLDLTDPKITVGILVAPLFVLFVGLWIVLWLRRSKHKKIDRSKNKPVQKIKQPAK
ncbi:hypothetical protein THOM_0568 [Trachipleistophora hominis]|uniref:Uncharacterized protein n=1 Tax=Trachipleistophora hominis TaxID=72359 RepID=L7JYF1_TRAHO|nr:hypothetical protein THOM_0568 [Trachipleistophora hominis]